MLFPSEQPGRRLRVALVGCGKHAFRSIVPCFDYLPVELAACCDADRARAEAFARRCGAAAACGSLDEVIARDDVEAVLLSVGPTEHPHLACQALEAGLHVWMEKPPSPDVAGVDRVLAARDAADRFVVVGFKKVFMPITRRMKQFMADERFGRALSMMARFPMDVPPDGPAVLAEARFTNWLGNGIHPLSALVELGGRPDSLVVHRAAGGGGFVVLNFPSGAVGCLHMAHGQSRAAPLERYEVVCENGHLINENNVRLIVARPGYKPDYHRTIDFTEAGEESAALLFEPQHTLSMLENKALFIQGFVQELDHFVTACLERTPPTLGTLEFSRAVMECYEAGLLSGGERVRLDEMPCNRR